MFSEEGVALLTSEELAEVTKYTIQKIRNYPKEYGHTVENYFNLLFPDELKSYVRRKVYV